MHCTCCNLSLIDGIRQRVPITAGAITRFAIVRIRTNTSVPTPHAISVQQGALKIGRQDPRALHGCTNHYSTR